MLRTICINAVKQLLSVFIPQKKSRSRTGGRRTFQHCEAANLKDPRNAAVRCFGVTKTYEHDLLGYLLTSLAQINFSYRTGVTCERGGT
ncbi:hypothetical protein evm_011020 [Chilo suppressalis]|nr:hypothetical protein evm_014252 [Chilo suppressalis]RVE44296.1 hypothetical protein evm_011020 [Chilo suppressalis]